MAEACIKICVLSVAAAMCIRTRVKETEMEEGAGWEEGDGLGTCYRNETQKTLCQ